MKKLFLMAAVAVAAMFTSCSKESGNDGIAQEGVPASLSLKISGSSNANSKATGTANETSEATVNRVAVLVFKANGSLDGMGEFTSAQLTALTTPKFNITSGTRDIYVVANAPVGAFSAVNNRAAFFAIKEVLSTQLDNNLTMSGERLAVSIIAGDNVLGGMGSPFTITRIASRVKLSWTLPASGLYKDKITVNKVYMLNTNSQSTYASATPNTLISSTLAHGCASSPAFPLQPTGTWAATSYLVEATNPTSGNVYFYAFENGATDATKIVIEATYNDGVAAPKTVYYPITVNKANANTTINGGTIGNDGAHTYIQRNNRYAISATINGIGAESPWEEITPATLQLTVTVADWPVEIVQAVTFN